LSESSFYLFRASGKWVSVKTVIILGNQENLDMRAVMILDSFSIDLKNFVSENFDLFMLLHKKVLSILLVLDNSCQTKKDSPNKLLIFI
jgi:hypothetical protein